MAASRDSVLVRLLPGTSLEAVKTSIQQSSKLAEKQRIVFGSSETTSLDDLAKCAAFARTLPGIRHVRLQSSAPPLADVESLRKLIAAGIDEFEISFDVDELTLQHAMENIVAEGAALTTRTTVGRSNFTHLPALVERAPALGASAVEICNTLPRDGEDDEQSQGASLSQVGPHLVAALGRAVELRIPTVVKWFPRCLLGDYEPLLDDILPEVARDASSEERESEPLHSCLFGGVCKDAPTDCFGLSHAYIREFGWEERLLRPRRTPPSVRNENESNIETRSLVQEAGPTRSDVEAVGAWLASLGLSLGDLIGGHRLANAGLGRHDAMLVFTLECDGAEFHIQVSVADPEQRAFLRTKSFNVSYFRVEPELEARAQAAARLLAQTLGVRDPGGLRLPSR